MKLISYIVPLCSGLAVVLNAPEDDEALFQWQCLLTREIEHSPYDERFAGFEIDEEGDLLQFRCTRGECEEDVSEDRHRLAQNLEAMFLQAQLPVMNLVTL